MTTILNELQKAINQLEQDKNALFVKMQRAVWKDDRYKDRVIPGKIISDEYLSYSVSEEKRLLPNDIGNLYQRWYSAAKTILDKNQPNRAAEFENAYLPKAKDKNPVGIKDLADRPETPELLSSGMNGRLKRSQL